MLLFRHFEWAKWSKILYAEIQNLEKKGIEAGAGNGIPQYTIMGRFIKALGMENLPNAWNILGIICLL